MAVKFSPWGNQQFLMQSGAPAVGYKLYCYAARSATPQSTFTDSTGSVPQTNPIIINAQGFPTNGQIWLTAGLSYKIVYADASDVVIKTEDDITGVNDSSSAIDQWAVSGLTPTYVSPTSFTLVGDQTQTFTLGRRLKLPVTAGTVYPTISSSAYTTLTTIGLTFEDSSLIDSGLSSVSYGVITPTSDSVPRGFSTGKEIAIASAATCNIGAVGSENVQITGTATITSFGTVNAGITRKGRFSGALTLTHNATSLILPGAVNITTAAGDTFEAISLGSGNWYLLSYSRANGAAISNIQINRRQSVQYGPTTGSPAQPDLIPQSQVGNTLAAGVTLKGSTSAALFSVANGFTVTGAQNDLNWVLSTDFTIPNLSASSTNYIWVDTVAQTCGAVTVADTFQSGGSASVANNAYTFDYSAMKMYLGNGATASQSNRLIVAEVDTSGTVVTAIRVRAYQRTYQNEQATLSFSTAYSFNHNIGTAMLSVDRWYECKTSDGGYAAGDRIYESYGDSNGTQSNGGPFWTTSKTCGITIGGGGAATLLSVANKSTGAVATLTPPNWKLGFVVRATW